MRTLLLLTMMAGVAGAQGTGCPATHGAARLAGVTLFDGPPSEMASLAPDVSRGTDRDLFQNWDVTGIVEGRGLYLACRYTGMKDEVVVKVDKKVKACTLRKTAGSVAVSCH